MNKHPPVPFKRTTALRPDLTRALTRYIGDNFREVSVEAFRNDIERLCRLREAAVEGAGVEVHREWVGKLISYNATLSYLLSKLPPDIGQTFPYFPPFPPSYSFAEPAPVPLPTLAHERAAVLFNLGALYANLGAEEPRSTTDSLKRAIASFQHAAGVFQHLLTLVPYLPSLANLGNTVYDFREGFLGTLKVLMWAMAQECFWQQAVLEKYKNGIISRLAMKVSELYDEALTASAKETPPSSAFLPPVWTALMNIKKHHFAAASQYRMSVEDLEKNRYGLEIARLDVAQAAAKKALSFAKPGIVSDAVIADIKGLSAAVAASLTRAKRDNDLIYLEHVPPPTELASIQGALMVKAVVPPEVDDSLGWLMREGGGLGWDGLVDYGVHLAISVYDDRKDSFVRDEIASAKTDADQLATTTLQSLNLPGALQAVERPIGLPPSLLGIAQDVRREHGAERVRKLMESIATLRSRTDASLNEVLDLLDQEAEEDETLRARYSAAQWRRPLSHEVNGQLIEQVELYRKTLQAAGESDAIVRQKWDMWEEKIEILGGSEEYLDGSIPRLPSGPSLTATPSARALHASLEKLADLAAARARILDSARAMASQDDVRAQVLGEANSIQRSAGTSGEVRVEWFESLFEKELRKYAGFKADLDANVAETESALEAIRVQNEEFLNSRRTSPIIKSREKALQSFDVAFQKYREVIRNLEEGTKFYSNLQSHLAKLSEDAKQWVWARRSDLSALTNALNNAHLAAQQPAAPSPAPSSPAAGAARPPPPPGSFQIPHPTSGQWASQLPSPPQTQQSASSPMPYAKVRGPASETASDVTITASPRRSQRKGGGVV